MIGIVLTSKKNPQTKYNELVKHIYNWKKKMTVSMFPISQAEKIVHRSTWMFLLEFVNEIDCVQIVSIPSSFPPSILGSKMAFWFPAKITHLNDFIKGLKRNTLPFMITSNTQSLAAGYA